MAVDKKLFIISAVITVLLFSSIYSLNIFLNRERVDVLSQKMDDVVDEYEELQTLALMSEVFGGEASCISMESAIKEMDKNLWDLGMKIDKYRSLSEEYMSDPFYLSQKKKFNRREVFYYSLLTDLNQKCNFSQNIILFFYKKAEECKDCDAMSFVLTNIKQEVNDEVAIFSFDMNMELPSIEVLTELYSVDEFPCTVINDKSVCGLQTKEDIINEICSNNNTFSLCKSS